MKSHRSRAPSNKTDSFCIIEYENHITRCFAQVIPNKRETTMVPIICSQVATGSIIQIDEHKSYSNWTKFDYTQLTVCHKYNFINRVNNAHTQAIESFHNELKLEIKRRKGTLTNSRSNFLSETCFYFNNRNNYFIEILNLIKINNLLLFFLYYYFRYCYILFLFWTLFWFKFHIFIFWDSRLKSSRGKILDVIQNFQFSCMMF